LGLGASLAACAEESRPPAEDPTLRQGAVPPGEDLGVLDTLSHLGYVDYAEPDGSAASGVVAHLPERASPGYTLVTSLPHGRATLVDMQGRELRSWTDPGGAAPRWSRARLLANGDVLCISPEADTLSRVRFDGTLVWHVPLEVHHDGIELPDGRLLVLTRRFRTIPAVDAERRSVDNLLTFLSADGEVTEEHSLYDLLAAEPRLLEVVRPPGLERLPPGYNIDPIHANTVFWLSDPGLPAVNPELRPGRVLVTLRYLDAVALLDLEERRCAWAWGRGELSGPHDASILANGHVLVLDNGLGRGWSRVVEVDPRQGVITWQYRAPVPERFHTEGRGTVQALPSGNVLVGNSNSGEAFEIGRDGAIVWRFLNPLRDVKGARGVIRVERYEPAFVEPLLARLAGR
jgi:hypothetical protein